MASKPKKPQPSPQNLGWNTRLCQQDADYHSHALELAWQTLPGPKPKTIPGDISKLAPHLLAPSLDSAPSPEDLFAAGPHGVALRAALLARHAPRTEHLLIACDKALHTALSTPDVPHPLSHLQHVEFCSSQNIETFLASPLPQATNDTPIDTLWLAAISPSHAHRMLKALAPRLKSDGQVFILGRDWVQIACKHSFDAAACTRSLYVDEVHTSAIAPSWILDDPYSLACFEAPTGAEGWHAVLEEILAAHSPKDEDPAASHALMDLRACPQRTLVLFDLDPSQIPNLNAATLQAWQTPSPNNVQTAKSHCEQHKDHTLWTWYGADGQGFTVAFYTTANEPTGNAEPKQTTCHKAHAVLSVLPHNPLLEHAVLGWLLKRLGSPTSRIVAEMRTKLASHDKNAPPFLQDSQDIGHPHHADFSPPKEPMPKTGPFRLRTGFLLIQQMDPQPLLLLYLPLLQQTHVPSSFYPSLERAFAGEPLHEEDRTNLDSLWQHRVLELGDPNDADPQVAEHLERGQAPLAHLWQSAQQQDASIEKAHSALLQVRSAQKHLRSSLGQLMAYPETVLRRAWLIQKRLAARNLTHTPHVAVLGDDDSLSIALAAMGLQVTVFEIDPQLCSLLHKQAQRLGLDITIHNCDLCEPLVAAQKDEALFTPDTLPVFDAFACDPMSNQDFFEVFLSRGASLMRTSGSLGFVAVHLPTQPLFAALCDRIGWKVQARHARFCRYANIHQERHPYTSDFVELQAGSDPLTPIVAADAYCMPLDLYREDHFHRPQSSSLFLDDIDNLPMATPKFLDLAVVMANQNIQTPIVSHPHFDDTWGLLICHSEHTAMSILIDRNCKNILMWNISAPTPHLDHTDFEHAMRTLLIRAHKKTPQGALQSAVGPKHIFVTLK